MITPTAISVFAAFALGILNDPRVPPVPIFVGVGGVWAMCLLAVVFAFGSKRCLRLDSTGFNQRIVLFGLQVSQESAEPGDIARFEIESSNFGEDSELHRIVILMIDGNRVLSLLYVDANAANELCARLNKALKNWKTV